MPSYYYWGEDRFLIQQAVQELRQRVVDPNLASFNDQRFSTVQDALNASVTPAFGPGGKVVILEGLPLKKDKEEEKTTKKEDPFLSELERTLAQIPAENHLVILQSAKPDRSLSRVLQKQGVTVQEFALIPAWKEDELIRRIQVLARKQALNLTPEAVQYLVEALGNDTARLHNELTKLSLCAAEPLGIDLVRQLVVSSAQTTFQLAEQILQGNVAPALATLGQLRSQNEVPLKIAAVLINQFRVWVWVRLLVEQGIDDPVAIAEQAEIGNPKRVYILKKQVQATTSKQLLACLPLLLDLEEGLKRGRDPQDLLTHIILALAQTCSRKK